MSFTAYPKIRQFRDICLAVKREVTFVGIGDDLDPVYDETIPLPVIRARGTVKIHGTNAGIGHNHEGVWFQARTREATIESDNAGFAAAMTPFRDELTSHLAQIAEDYDVDLKENSVVAYGEWCGKGIQKGVGVNQIPKCLVLFELKIKPHNTDLESTYIPIKSLELSGHLKNSKLFYRSCDFEQYWIDLDFQNAEETYEALQKLTERVEARCPVADAFDAEGTGEGIVWSLETPEGTLLRFKVKGEEHAKHAARVKTERPEGEINELTELAQKICPEWRLQQMYDETFDTINGGTCPGMQGMGSFLKALNKDVIEEEGLTVTEAGHDWKAVAGFVANRARAWFTDTINREALS